MEGPTPERIPCFVYGTLCTGFKNHKNVVKGRHLQAVPARLPSAAVFHFGGRGFPGAVPLSSSPDYAEFASQASPSLLASLQSLTRPNGEAVELLSASGVIGQLLWFDEKDWPAAAKDLDVLEAYYAPNDSRNMYYRQKVKVEVLEPSSRAPSQPSSRRGSLATVATPSEDAGVTTSVAADAAPSSGAGAMPTIAAESPISRPSPGTIVEAYVYWCLLDPATPALNSELVIHGWWKKHLHSTGQTDAGDDWSDCLEEGKDSEDKEKPAVGPSTSA
jgi:gamma-glutamylcyclotransferase (GGCT)/AIG2-like uncharacterized protein YtfP